MITAIAGLAMHQVAHCEMLHRDIEGGVHIHTSNVQMDLETGKRLNIAPPGWERDFSTLRDWLNIGTDGRGLTIRVGTGC